MALFCTYLRLVTVLYLFYNVSYALPQQGRWAFDFSVDNQIVAVTKSTYNNTRLFLKLECHPDDSVGQDVYITLSFVIRKLLCSSEIQSTNETLMQYHRNPEHPISDLYEHDIAYVYKSPLIALRCGKDIILPSDENENLKVFHGNATTSEHQPHFEGTIAVKQDAMNLDNLPIEKRELPEETENKTATNQKVTEPTMTSTSSHKTEIKPIISRDPRPQFILRVDGVYLITVAIEPNGSNTKYHAELDMEIMGNDGYLSAKDWPLLPFYGAMCLVYVIYGMAWMIVSACQWRDLLRIQFWIGGVILLGMLESAVFYAEYQSVKSTGKSVRGAMLFAEIVSCMKRSLARMLIIIVSLGFGIVKPRLGPMFQRVIGVGVMYFILASIDGYLRVMETDRSSTQQMILGQMPLTVLDAAICWWIFSSLVHTTRTLRLRRNIVKLNLYRHFTNTLVFVVLASVPFMIWTIRTYRMADCITDWKELWFEQAYWPLLFSVILLVIMILWRPTINNQRYAFSPLLDTSDEEEEEEMLPNGAYEGMKSRVSKTHGEQLYSDTNDKSKIEDDLKWVDEHIPSSMADVALPALLDSDEEEMNTEFEISKMQ